MKKWLTTGMAVLFAQTVVLAAGSPAPEAPWGGNKRTFQDERASVEGADESLEKAFDNVVVSKRRIVLPRILQDQPLRLKIKYDSVFSINLNLLSVWVELAYNSWFQNALKHIYASVKEDKAIKGKMIEMPLNGEKRTVHKNTKEWFADIIPVLRTGVRVKVVSENETADLIVRVFDTTEKLRDACDCSACLACAYSGASEEEPPEIILGQNWNEGILQHEIGHTFGLTDVYGKAYQENSAEYYHSTANSESSIMQGSRLGHLTCDDANGLINVIDLVRHTKTERVRKGWHSLCPVNTEDVAEREDTRDVYRYASPDGRRTHANLIAALEQL